MNADTAQASRLGAQQVSLGYGERLVINDLDVSIPDGKITMIVGANACGKSTLLRGLSRLLKPSGGTVLLDGKDIHQRSGKEVATSLGLLPQQPIVPDGITVEELVGRGRYPHQGWMKSFSAADAAIVAEAMEMTGTTHLAQRGLDELSGGQRQRVWIAMVLAQQTPLLLLDEPTTFLDLSHQIDVLELVTDLNRRLGTTVVIVLHELNLAARYGQHMIAMKEGSILAQGPASEVVTEANVREVFDLDAMIMPDPLVGAPMVIPRSPHPEKGA